MYMKMSPITHEIYYIDKLNFIQFSGITISEVSLIAVGCEYQFLSTSWNNGILSFISLHSYPTYKIRASTATVQYIIISTSSR